MYIYAVWILTLLSIASTQKTFPTLPSQFTSGIEYKIVDKDRTGAIWEYYDTTQHRIRFDSFENGVYNTQIFLPLQNGGIRYSIQNNAICSVQAMSSNTSFLQSNTTIPSSEQFLTFGLTSTAVYQGVTTIRNIPCDYWISSYTNSTTGYSYTVTFYFNSNTWSLLGSLNNITSVPVRFLLNGTHDYGNGTIYPFTHYYDYFEFITDPIPDVIFSIDPSLRCGWISNPPFPILPSTFKARFERNDFRRNTTTYFEEWYDALNQRIRFSTLRNGSEIDYIIKLQEGTVVTLTNNNACSIQLLPNSTNLSGGLASTYDIFGIGASSTYQGIDTVRNIQCDVWLSQINRTNVTGTIESYFAVSSWNIPGDELTNFRVLVRTVTQGTFLSGNYNFTFNYQDDYVGFTPIQSWDASYFYVEDYYNCGSLTKKPMPTVINQWSAILEITFNGDTDSYNTFYDYNGQRVRQFRPTATSVEDTLLYFQNGSKIVHTINNGINSCTRTTMNDNDKNIFADSQGKLRDTISFFDIQSNEIYQGQFYVREILCDYWSTSTPVKIQYDGNYYLCNVTHYFVSTDWQFDLKNTSSYGVPARIVYSGYQSDNPSIPFNFQYDFFNFAPLSAAVNFLFYIQTSYLCPNINNKPLPMLPPSFRTVVEVNHLQEKFTGDYQITIDTVQNNFKMEYYNSTGYWIFLMRGFAKENWTIVFDTEFNSYCYQTGNFVDTTTNDQTPFGPLELLSLQPPPGIISYVGVSTSLRGIPVDVWTFPITKMYNGKNFTGNIVWSYNTDSWNSNAGPLMKVPITIEVLGGLMDMNSNQVIDVYDRFDIVNFVPADTSFEDFELDLDWACEEDDNSFDNVENTLFTTFKLNIPIWLVHSDDLIKNISTLLNINTQNIQVLKAIEIDSSTSFAFIEIQTTPDQKVALQNKIRQSSNSSLSSSIISGSYAADIGCDACYHGTCYFGECICDAGWTGDSCLSDGQTAHVNVKSEADYLGAFIAIAIVMLFVGFLAGFGSYRFFYRKDYKVLLKSQENNNTTKAENNKDNQLSSTSSSLSSD